MHHASVTNAQFELGMAARFLHTRKLLIMLRSATGIGPKWLKTVQEARSLWTVAVQELQLFSADSKRP